MTAAKENVTQNGDEPIKAPLGLKILVVVLGIAIVVMLVLIIWKVMVGDGKESRPETVAVSEVQLGSSPFLVDMAIERPAGSELVSTKASATEIILHFSSSEADMIVIIDRRSGKESRLTIAK